MKKSDSLHFKNSIYYAYGCERDGTKEKERNGQKINSACSFSRTLSRLLSFPSFFV